MCFVEFRCGWTSMTNAQSSGQPTEVASPETIEKIQDMELADWKFIVLQIMEAMDISYGSVDWILGIRKWVS